MAEQDGPPQAPENPYLPPGPAPLICEEFDGMDTSSTRLGVDDKRCWWIDGFFPLTRRNLRTLYGIGPLLYTSPGGTTIVYYDFANIGTTPYAIVFLSNGRVDAVRTDTGAVTTILVASSINAPSITSVGITQWGRQYVIIVSAQTNGYWVWDGTIVYTAGTLAPVIIITNNGSAYQSVPAVTATGGRGSGATFAAVIANGIVTGASITNPGSGYLGGDSVLLVFTGGNAGGSGGSITAALSSTHGSGGTIVLTGGFGTELYGVTSASVTAGGSGYTQFTSVSVSTNAASTARTAVLGLTISSGIITGVTIIDGGAYFNSSLPTFTATVIDNGQFFVNSTSIIAAGSGYSGSIRLTCSGGGTPVSQASLQANLTNGSITSVTIQNGGVYGSNTPPTIAITDPVVTATGTASLMPFGIQGSTVQPYSGRVWVANSASVYFSAPGSVSDFATSNGGGNFISTDAFLRTNFSRLLQTNGFLYLIGDSSINYISGVVTSGSPPTTAYTNQNADPQVGTPYPAAADLFGRNIVFANSFGVHVSYGAAVTKVSEQLDGVWSTVANFGALQLSMANANIFGRRVVMVLAKIVDPVTGSTVNKLFLWDGKRWFAASQDLALTFINHQEINSIFTTWGTDGTHIYPLFQQAATGFSKIVQTKLWDAPGGYQFIKTSTRFWALALYYSGASSNLVVSIDNELNSSPYTVPSSTYTLTGPAGAGYFATPPQSIGQQGVLTGMTIKTSAGDMAIASMMMQDEVVAYRG